MRRPSIFLLACSLFLLGACGGGGSGQRSHDTISGDYVLIAWNDLGMHCMDDDYSVFSILPPYNNLHAQLINRTTGTLVSSGVTLTYEATKDTRGSINTSGSTKTNFWDWVFSLFGVNLQSNMGLAGNPVQSKTPAPMVYEPVNGYWKAEGIPAVPYDDSGKTQYYPMVKVVAKDLNGNVLAVAKTVLPVSDEMTCKRCHTSNAGDPDAQPSGGWVNDPYPGKDFRRNILKLHDERNNNDPRYTAALSTNGYHQAGLLSTSDSGKSILCANCHASNALGKQGITTIKPLTEAMHSWHAHVMDEETDKPLDDSTGRSACYNCHPGSETQCLRGVMGIAKDSQGNLLLQCQSCHGTMSTVGANGRSGWTDLPGCQSCHYLSGSTGNYVRDITVFDSPGEFRQTSSIFSSGKNLYKVSAEHGGVQCEACHGATHAEYATSEENDNVQSNDLQGYPGTVTECTVCHANVPLTKDKGPHGLHTIGQAWVTNHGSFAEENVTPCATCHGTDYRGTFLSRVSVQRSFTADEFGLKTYGKGMSVSCYDCHNGPDDHDE